MRRSISCSILLLLMFSFSTSPAARVWHLKPDGTGDAPNIQAAIDSCARGDTVLAASGTYQGEGNHDIDFKGKAIVVCGGALIGGGPRTFYFHSGEDTSSVLEGFAMDVGSGIECDNSSPTIRNNTFFDNQALYLHKSSSRIYNNRIGNLTTVGYIMRCDSDSSVIMGNTIRGDEDSWLITCRDSYNRIVGNIIHGGAPISCQGGSYEILNNSIHAAAPYGSPGMAFQDANSRIIGNHVSGHSDVISISHGTHSIRGNTIEGGGSGIFCEFIDSKTTISENDIIDNRYFDLVPVRGSGIYCSNASPVIQNNIIARNGNSDTPEGGGIFCGGGSSPDIVNNTIVANTACFSAIFCGGRSSPVIRNCILADNKILCSPGGSIHVADSSSSPLVSCCDVITMSGLNYVGIPDQTGLNGNISVDPIFCDAANGDYHLHALSPCLAGNHPGGSDCGLIGALGQGCDYTATLLQEYHTEIEASAISITWKLSEAGSGMNFFVLRSEMPSTEYKEISNAAIGREGLTFTFRDTDCKPGAMYRYRVEVSDEAGRRLLFDTEAVTLAPPRLALDQNYPNPFNPTTRIAYSLPSKTRVAVEIYDIAGRRIVQLVDEDKAGGAYVAEWNGRDDRGVAAASGVYFCRLTAGKGTISRKMVLLR